MQVVSILHGDNIRVDYIGLDVSGVQVGNMVEGGKEIGTAVVGSHVQFKAYVYDVQVKGFQIENNTIIWPN